MPRCLPQARLERGLPSLLLGPLDIVSAGLRGTTNAARIDLPRGGAAGRVAARCGVRLTGVRTRRCVAWRVLLGPEPRRIAIAMHGLLCMAAHMGESGLTDKRLCDIQLTL